MKQPFGPTGRFPRGKLNAEDDGEAQIGVAPCHSTGLVQVNFGTPVSWLGLDPNSARQIALAILRAAGQIDGQITSVKTEAPATKPVTSASE